MSVTPPFVCPCCLSVFLAHSQSRHAKKTKQKRKKKKCTVTHCRAKLYKRTLIFPQSQIWFLLSLGSWDWFFFFLFLRSSHHTTPSTFPTPFHTHTHLSTMADSTTQVHEMFDTILILDFGSQYSHLITRRIREFGVYCELLPCTQKISELGWKPTGMSPLPSPCFLFSDHMGLQQPYLRMYNLPTLNLYRCHSVRKPLLHLRPRCSPCRSRCL